MTITAEELKKMITDELTGLNFSFDENGELVPPSSEKENLRLLHKPSREIELKKNQDWIQKNFSRYRHFFANGIDIKPPTIKPVLVRVTEPWHSDLFRLARFFWSIPYSFGFGRRLRYLIFDESNEKLMGIFGLQSPPIAFPARDCLFQYPQGQKTELVNQTMDVFTLGAIPPYNRLLGGKLVALSVVANEVRQAYQNSYSGRETKMERRVLPANLVALTTTSAFGRSSIYNRLKYNNATIAESIGYTKGYGNFHLQKLYPYFKEFLASQEINVLGGYGTGPRRSWQLTRRALDKLGLSADLLKHGVKREVFLFRLVDNLNEYMNGESDRPQYRNLPFCDLADFWKERWLKGRFERVDGWHAWDNQEILNNLTVVGNITTPGMLDKNA